MQKILSEKELDILLASFLGIKYETNCYLLKAGFIELIKKESLYYIQKGDNLGLLLEKLNGDFLDLLFFIKDIDTPFIINNKVPVVIEIPYRGPNFFPLKVIKYWEKNGFKQHINRDLYALNYKTFRALNFSISPVQCKIVESIHDAGVILEMIEKTFDRFTGDMLVIPEIESSILSEEILGAYDNKTLIGFLRFYTKNNISWIGHIAVSQNYRGKGIGTALIQNYIQRQINLGFEKFQQWVVSDNQPAVRLYSEFGFQYINKSSISLLMT